MDYEAEIRRAITKHRDTANALIEAKQGPPNDTVTLALVLNGLADGIQDALALISRQINELAADTPK